MQIGVHVNQKKEETDYGDDVPLISQRGYAISLADAAVKVKKAKKALDEARKKIVCCR